MCSGYVVEFATKLYEAVFKPLKPLISKELAVFLLHGRVFSQGVFRGCSRFYEHGVFRVFRGVFTPLRCSIGNTIIETFACVGNDHAKVPVIAVYHDVVLTS